MKRTLTGYTAVCLLTGSLFYTSMPVVVAASTQSANRTTQEVSRTPGRSKIAEARQTPVMAKSSPEIAIAKTPKKDAPGKRFWGRIMDHFREIHSAEKKPK